MKIYDTWAIAAKRNDTDVKYVETCNLTRWMEIAAYYYLFNLQFQWSAEIF